MTNEQKTEISFAIKEYLKTRHSSIAIGSTIHNFYDNHLLCQNLEFLHCAEITGGADGQIVSLGGDSVEIVTYFFQLSDDDQKTAKVSLEDFDDSLPAFQEYLLPSREFTHLWDSLVYDSDIQTRLLALSQKSILFSDHSVDQSLISWNR